MDDEIIPEVSLYFRFYGDAFDPDEISRRLGVQPTNKFRPGDPIDEEGRARWPGYGWVIKVGPRQTLDIEEMLGELQKRANVSPQVVRQTCAELDLDLVITCAVSGEETDSMPVMFFSEEFLSWAVGLGASLNVYVAA